MGQITDLPVPRTRGGYHTQLFERYQRRRNELDQASGQMFIKGLSTRQVGQVIETLTGSKPSPFASLPYLGSRVCAVEDPSVRGALCLCGRPMAPTSP